MYIGITGLKGGVSKTTTAINLAGALHKTAPTLVIDADPNRSATTWARKGKLPFKVVSELAAAKYVKNNKHIVFDTKARPENEDLEDLVRECDLVILPTIPNGLALDGLFKTGEAIKSLSQVQATVRVLLTQVRGERAAIEARELIEQLGLQTFKAQIPKLVVFERSFEQGLLVEECRDEKARAAWDSYMRLAKEILHG